MNYSFGSFYTSFPIPTGSYRTLILFLRHNPTCIIAKDWNGLFPSTHALRRGHWECWKLLMVAQFQFHSVCNLSLSIYSKVKSCAACRWQM